MGSTDCRRLVAALSFCAILIALNFKETTAYTLEEAPLSHFTLGRNLLQGNNVSEVRKDLGDTVRVDPLNKLKKYRGGYNITNKHYWSSLVFTGIYGYAFGGFWLLCGVVYGIILLSTRLCCSHENKRKLKKKVACSRHCYLWPILLGISLTILAVISCGIVLDGSSKFHSRAKTIMGIIIETADGATDTMYNVTGVMKSISDRLPMSNDGKKASKFLNTTSRKLNTEAAEIRRQASKNRRLIEKGLRIIYITTTVAFSLSMVAVVALSISGFLKFRRLLHLLIILCWLLAVICWIYFGLFFFIEKFTIDTCTALQDFQQDPMNNSLSSIIPCNALGSAKLVLFDTRAGIYTVINKVNENISNIGLLSFPTTAMICNPFSAPPDYNYQPNNCPANSIRIGDIPNILKVFTCSNGEAGPCKQGEFISANDFRMVEAYTSLIQNLLDVLPNMESLVQCQIVKDAFAEIISSHCKPVKRYAKMVWVSTVVLSMTMVVLIILYASKASYDGKRHFSDGSVKPHLATLDESDDKDRTKSSNQEDLKLDV